MHLEVFLIILLLLISSNQDFILLSFPSGSLERLSYIEDQQVLVSTLLEEKMEKEFSSLSSLQEGQLT